MRCEVSWVWEMGEEGERGKGVPCWRLGEGFSVVVDVVWVLC